MIRKSHTKHIYEGNYVAEVEVELLITDEGNAGWSPYLSLEDAYKLDDVRAALRRGDLQTASQQARIYKLVPVPA
jgi:hypothetical protein